MANPIPDHTTRQIEALAQLGRVVGALEGIASEQVANGTIAGAPPKPTLTTEEAEGLRGAAQIIAGCCASLIARLAASIVPTGLDKQ